MSSRVTFTLTFAQYVISAASGPLIKIRDGIMGTVFVVTVQCDVNEIMY